MCIVVIKEKDVKLPDMDTLKNCWDNNPDGAGFMYLDKGVIHIKKGFMTWTAFKRAYKAQHFTDQDTFVLHFRIATHGEIDKEHCHPFPISAKKVDLFNCDVVTTYAMAHNGMIDIDCNNGLSDSQQFVADYLKPIGKQIFTNNAICRLVEDATMGSKLCLWHINKGMLLTGSWITENGIKYSNTGYKAKPVYYVPEHIPSDYYSITWKNYTDMIANDGSEDITYCEQCGEWVPDENVVARAYYCENCGYIKS